MFVCLSVIQNKQKSLPPSDVCPYVTVWRKRVRGEHKFWELDQKLSVLTHMVHCGSGQHVTACELQNDVQWITSVNINKRVTGKALAQEAIGYKGRFAGSTKAWTARRAKNRIRNQSKMYYKDDWSKLKGWGRQFLRLNPGSTFELATDNEGRYVLCTRTGPQALPHTTTGPRPHVVPRARTGPHVPARTAADPHVLPQNFRLNTNAFK